MVRTWTHMLRFPRSLTRPAVITPDSYRSSPCVYGWKVSSCRTQSSFVHRDNQEDWNDSAASWMHFVPRRLKIRIQTNISLIQSFISLGHISSPSWAPLGVCSTAHRPDLVRSLVNEAMCKTAAHMFTGVCPSMKTGNKTTFTGIHTLHQQTHDSHA